MVQRHFWEKVHVFEILSARKVKLGIKWCKVLNIYVLFFMLSTKNIAVFTWFLIKWNQIKNDLRSFECNLCNCIRSLKILQEFNLFNHDLAIPVRCSNQLSSWFNFQFLIKSKMANITVTYRTSATPLPMKYTSSCSGDQRLSIEGKIVSKYFNISKTQGRGSISLHPFYNGGGMTLRLRPRVKPWEGWVLVTKLT